MPGLMTAAGHTPAINTGDRVRGGIANTRRAAAFRSILRSVPHSPAVLFPDCPNVLSKILYGLSPDGRGSCELRNVRGWVVCGRLRERTARHDASSAYESGRRLQASPVNSVHENPSRLSIVSWTKHVDIKPALGRHSTLQAG